MASLTIRRLDESLKKRLRLRAASHGVSMEEEARAILKKSLSGKTQTGLDLYRAIRRHVEPLGGIELELPRRGPIRKPSTFE